MSRIKFWKTETVGNDFVLVHSEDVGHLNLNELAVRVCERRFSVGADGLLVVEKATHGMTLRMFNPDGTEDFCGNGLRCAGWHGFQQGWVETNFEIKHGGRLIPTSITEESRVSISLPAASFRPRDIPVESFAEFIDQTVAGQKGTAVSTGTAHFVVLRDELPDDDEFSTISPLIEHDPLFPERTSVMYTQVLAPAHLKLRIWERGAGETLGCGTGSVAAAVVWARKESYSGPILVTNPGGDIIVRLSSWKDPVMSESSPRETYTGTLANESSVKVSKASLY